MMIMMMIMMMMIVIMPFISRCVTMDLIVGTCSAMDQTAPLYVKIKPPVVICFARLILAHSIVKAGPFVT